MGRRVNAPGTAGAAGASLPHPAAVDVDVHHTLTAYAVGARLGADYIEPDLVSTKDGALVVDGVFSDNSDTAAEAREG